VWHDAEKIYGKIAAVAPENAVGFIGMGYSYISRGDYVSAEKNFMLALQKANSMQLREECLVVLGTINGISNNFDRSESYLQEAVKINPKNSEAWTGLGSVAWMRGRAEDAITFYEKALSARPNNYEAAINLAAVYDKTGQSQRGDLMRQQAAGMSH
jgi:Flp pilus assembly protein TadD